MPQHTEEEVRRKAAQRQAAIAELTPEKPGFAASLGQAFGRGARTNRERAAVDAEAAATKKNVNKLRIQEANASIGGIFRRIGAGFRAGSGGRPIDTSEFRPGVGTTDNTPRPDAVREFEETGFRVAQPGDPDLFPGQGDQALEQLRRGPEDQIVVSDRQPASDPFNPDVQPDITRPQLLSQTGATIARGGNKEPVARPDGQFKGGVPEGFINVLRGTRSSFLRVDEQGNAGDRNTEFRAVPGQTLDQAEQIGARRDPAFNVVTKEILDNQNAGSQRIEAEAQQLNAIANSQFDAVNANDELEIFTRGVDGVAIGSGLTPDTIVNGEDEFTFETVEVSTGFAGQTEKRTVMVDRDGTRINVSEEFRQDSGRLEYVKLKKRNPDASPEELVQEAEDLVGGGALTDLRAELGL